MKAVIYARYSSSSQTEQSIDGQLRDCYEYAKKHDITVVDTYIDRATTGTNDNREQFQLMLKDSDKHLFDVVIVYKIDRFARNRYDSAMNKARLKKNGVKVLYAKESIPDGPEGIILESLLEGMAEFYSAELSDKIKRGMRESAYKCHATGGNIALGYKIAKDKSFEIDPDTAPIVQMIFKLYDSGKNNTEICNELNSLGYKTSRGVAFNKNSLRSILKNKKYIGIYKCNNIEIEDGVPAIVDKELFDKVQKRMAANKRAPAHSKGGKVDYLLTGKLYCGHCGAGMVGESGTGKSGEKHHYYICTTKKRKKACCKKTVRKNWLEQLVVEETAKYILHPQKIKHIANRCVEIQDKDNSNDFEISNLKKQLSNTEKSINNLMSAIEQGIVTKTTKDRLTELEQIHDKLEYEISMYKLNQPDLVEDKVIFMLSQFENLNPKTKDYYSNIIDCFINSVHLYNDKIIITYNLTKNKTELESSVLELISKTTNADCNNICEGSDLTLIVRVNRFGPQSKTFNYSS